MSPENLYFRFFSASPAAAEHEARRVCLEADQGLVALLGLLGDELVGVASYELIAEAAAAEVALAVADGMHRRGVATLLLEHLVSLARARGVNMFVAEVLPDNSSVLHVLGDAGLAVRRRFGNGVIDLVLPIPPNAALGEASVYLDAVADREQRADVASLEPLLNPRSAAVVGTGHRPGSIGRTILLNIRDAGFAGTLYAVNPHGGDIEGIPCFPSVAALPEAPDLVVVTVPAARVVEVGAGVRAARNQIAGGDHRGPHAGAGIRPAGGQPARGHAPGRPELLRRRGAGHGLEATFAVHHPSPGKTGLVVQSGGVGAALVEQFSRLGIGTSSFASVGDMLDVSGTDMLLWWEADNTTELAVLYLESFGNPRTVRADRAPGERQGPHPHRPRRAVGPGPACRRLAHRSGSRAADHPAGACSTRRALSPPPASANCSTRPC